MASTSCMKPFTWCWISGCAAVLWSATAAASQRNKAKTTTLVLSLSKRGLTGLNKLAALTLQGGGSLGRKMVCTGAKRVPILRTFFTFWVPIYVSESLFSVKNVCMKQQRINLIWSVISKFLHHYVHICRHWFCVHYWQILIFTSTYTLNSFWLVKLKS